MKLIPLMRLLRINADDILAVLKSKTLFRNWYIIPLLYMFCKVLKLDLLECKVRVVCKRGRSSIVPLEIWGQVIRGYYYGFIQSIACSENFIIADDVKINFCKSKETINIGIARFKELCYSILNTLLNTFITNIYGLLNVRNKIVIDVGAYIGDSAIYFALRGAKKVIAIEPHPLAFKEMLENIKLNNLEKVIAPINAGLASRSGGICIKNVNVEETESTYHSPGACDTNVPAITLSEVISKYGVAGDLFVLKMDCEGCEYDVILNEYEHIKLFEELVVEYHGSLENILNMLRKDFNCLNIKRYNLLYCRRRHGDLAL
jgi:FkbM family methyltransferase